MATKDERSDVPAPWGAWLAFGVAMVCSGGLPAVVWAGHCCCGEGRRLFGAVVVPLGQPTAPAIATRPTGALAKAACGLGVVWGRVSGM